MDPAEKPEPYAEAARKRTGLRGRAEWYEHASAASIGIEMAVAITLGAISGMWLEAHVTHWAPWTTLIGLMFGIAAAALAIVRTIKEDDLRRKAKQAERAQAAQAPQEGSDRSGDVSLASIAATNGEIAPSDPLSQVLAGGRSGRKAEPMLTDGERGVPSKRKLQDLAASNGGKSPQADHRDAGS